MISAVILAAGSSSRMRATIENSTIENATIEQYSKSEPIHKLLLPLGDKTIIEHVVDNALNSQAGEVLIVLGYQNEQIAAQLSDRDVTLIINQNYQEGQSTSVKKSVEFLSPDSQGALFLLGDQPFIPVRLINKLIQNGSHQDCHISYPIFQGMRGNPVLFSSSQYEALSTQTGDRGGRQLIEQVPDERHCPIKTEERGVHMDIDTYQEYLAAVTYYNNSYNQY